ncbi:DUF433 domain-containing protein [Roseateles amylovorans]|uniref:DUF433 domain-containing protein n=1 Tax=Roseateles amylovorans TaxID=2978473 RepID=A0ABY6B4Q0_9BURK|nr:DUF433 domain-containing protein [Roseateles amylovorans]UXH79267.1 DUF433 domain-containing protein [Roseateles amylovorans]
MITSLPFVPAAEAAYIGGVSAAQMNRLVDEELVPSSLFRKENGARTVARLMAAYANFFFATDAVLLAAARKQVLADVTARLEQSQVRDQLFALQFVSDAAIDWTVATPGRGVVIDIWGYVCEAASRAREVDNAGKLILEDPEVMGGVPCFAGTRVPIEHVLASIQAAIDPLRLQLAYPFLTPAHIEAAQIFYDAHPRRGRPRRLNDIHPAEPLKRGQRMLKKRLP